MKNLTLKQKTIIHSAFIMGIIYIFALIGILYTVAPFNSLVS